MNQSDRPITRSQQYAQRAFGCIQRRSDELKGGDKKKARKEFSGFAKRFPTLIHTCGLCQAFAFAQAKDRNDYLHDIATVLERQSKEELLAKARSAAVAEYMDLSRNTITAASWLKRYTEALLGDDDQKGGE